ncbi:MAG: exonuclease SbcCD subunit D [Candidatus Nanoarchaeia archaeon]
MKFAHLADVHIGSWRDPRLRDVSTQLFCKAMRICVREEVDFILISGDLFNTSMPSIDHLRAVVEVLKDVNAVAIPVYYIAGSHDFSSSGKTMLDVLQAAGLATNIARGEEVDGKLQLKFFKDKSGVKIAGMVGKKGGLETAYYDNLDYRHLEDESGPKVFMFHSAIAEMKPKFLEQMPAAPLSILPKGFEYYAGGHVHVIDQQDFPAHKNVTFPGPIFPCSFSELEKLGHGGFYIVETHNSKAVGAQEGSLPNYWKSRYVDLDVHPAKNYKFDCNHKTPSQIEEEVIGKLEHEDLQGAIVTLRFKGTLQGGKVADIQYRDIIRTCYKRGAKSVLRNTYDLRSADLDAVKVDVSSVEDVEAKLIEENAGQSMFEAEEEKKLVRGLMESLAAEKEEGETNTEFEKRVQEDVDVLFN